MRSSGPLSMIFEVCCTLTVLKRPTQKISQQNDVTKNWTLILASWWVAHALNLKLIQDFDTANNFFLHVNSMQNQEVMELFTAVSFVMYKTHLKLQAGLGGGGSEWDKINMS